METCKPRKKRKKLLICVRSKSCKEKKVSNLHKECQVSLLYSFTLVQERLSPSLSLSLSLSCSEGGKKGIANGGKQTKTKERERENKIFHRP